MRARISRIAGGSLKPRGRKAGGDRAGLAVRRAALEVLLRVDQRSGFADVILGHRGREFAPADRRLLTRLVLGTIAWRGRLDYEIGALCSTRLDRLEPAVLAILRLGLFQLRFLNRIPHHAAVDTAVTLTRENRATRAATGLVNAVLRRAAVRPVALPDRAADEIGYLSVACSHPRWLVEKFVEWFGPADAEGLMTADNQAAPNAIRLNLARAAQQALLERLSGDGLKPLPGGRLEESATLAGGIGFDSPSYRRGLFHAQSEASQLVSRMLAPVRGAAVVDCAAAPGGKATHLAELVGARGRVIALDSNLAGLSKARALAERLGHQNLTFIRADGAEAIALRPASCGFVLLDAPCTGLGTLREHPEIRWRLRCGDLSRMAALQSRMLENAAGLVRPGGAIVYAVCSFAPEEGRDVVRKFLSRHPDYSVDRAPPIARLLPAAFDSEGMMLTRPDRDGLDGFFAARVTRR